MNTTEKYSQNICMVIISFIVLILGGLNWLSIGLLQYDFVAGFFGTQASIFSRLVYIVIGVACFIILFNMLKNKGKVILFQRKRRKNNEDEAILEDNN